MIHRACNVLPLMETHLQSIFPLPRDVQAFFTVAEAYSKQYAHISIVDCPTQRMKVVGYNGILFQDVLDQLQHTKVWGIINTLHPWGIAVRPQVHKKKGRQNVWSTIIIKPSDPYAKSFKSIEASEKANCLETRCCEIHLVYKWASTLYPAFFYTWGLTRLLLLLPPGWCRRAGDPVSPVSHFRHYKSLDTDASEHSQRDFPFLAIKTFSTSCGGRPSTYQGLRIWFFGFVTWTLEYLSSFLPSGSHAGESLTY